MLALVLRHHPDNAVWAELVPELVTSDDKFGRLRLVARRGHTALGAIEPRYARHAEPLFSTVLDEGITHGIVAFSDIDDTAPRAHLTIGARHPVPVWDFLPHPSLGR
ncbi:hypothetical protein C5C17_13735 [Pseudoclavibacter sp. RFBA6]|nr:hypothetical protein C5C17_13735 [Pseudoclavibacter sp. RFBA6]